MISSLNTTKSVAVTPDEVIEACDRALEAKKDELRVCDLGVKIRDDENERLRKENTDLRESKDAFYKNPYLLLLLGFVAGAVVTR